MGGARSILASLSRARARGRLAGAIARASLAAAAGAGIALAVHAPDARPEARLERVAGTLAIANSHNGAAILSASHMRPGGAASGTVTIANAGSVPGDFSLSSFDLTDTPGRGGGLLSSFLAATVQDVTDPAAAHDVYRGPLGAMPVRPLGTFAAGEQRIYAFRVELPAAAPGLDAVQGASVSVGYRWDATGSDDGNRTNPTDTTPTAPTTPTETTLGTTPTGTPPPPPAPVAPTLKITGKRSWSVRSRKAPTVLATCGAPCTMRVAVRAVGLPRGLRVRSRLVPAAGRGRSSKFTLVISRRVRAAFRARTARLRPAAIVVRVTVTEPSGALSKTRKKTIRVTR